MNLQREKLIVEEAKTNNLAFGQLFDEYYTAIFKYVLKRVADSVIAQDITSETFLKALQNIEKFQWRDVSISSWFYKIATNEIRMYFRRGKYTPRSLEQLYDEQGFEPESDEDLVVELIEAQTLLERNKSFLEAQRILSTLPIKYQEVISLRFFEKQRLSDIALILGKKEGTVKSLLSRGLKKLKEQLETRAMQPNPHPDIVVSEGLLINKPQESYEE